LREIETEEIFSNQEKKKTFFYKTCKICGRISKLKYVPKKITSCDFLHYFSKSLFFFLVQYKFNYLISWKLQTNRVETMLFDEILKKFFSEKTKYLINQKEFIWL